MITANDLKSALNDDEKAKALIESINNGSGDYKTAASYAENIGAILQKLLNGQLPESPEYAEAAEVLRPLLSSAYNTSGEAAVAVQKTLNSKAGIGLASIKPETDIERINNLIYKLCGGTIEEYGWLLESPALGNFCRSAVTATIVVNAEFQKKAGLPAYIERDSGSGCCAWCDSMAGLYEYGKQPADFFRVHKDCTCVINYMPTKTRWQRISYKTNANGTMNKITTDIGLRQKVHIPLWEQLKSGKGGKRPL